MTLNLMISKGGFAVKKYIRIFIMLIIATLFLNSFTATAFASSTNKKDLRVICEYEGEIIPEMEISIYKAVLRNDDMLTLTGDFKDYRVRLDISSASVLQEAADTLANYVVVDKIKPLQTVKSDEYGNADFSQLDNGVYLVCGKKLAIGDNIYRFSPMFVEINDNSADTKISYGKFVVTDVKNSKMTKYILKKVWDNERDILEYRPDSIDVVIFLDGEEFETVSLDDSNNWTYEWMSDENGDWNFKEIGSPEQYDVAIKIGENHITITNRLKDEIKPPPMPTPPSEDIDTDKDEDIPQTGQLWWPVPLMALVGVVLIVLGLKLGFKGEKE